MLDGWDSLNDCRQNWREVVGTSQMAGTEIMRIADLSDMEVVVDVNENDILK